MTGREVPRSQNVSGFPAFLDFRQIIASEQRQKTCEAPREGWEALLSQRSTSHRRKETSKVSTRARSIRPAAAVVVRRAARRRPSRPHRETRENDGDDASVFFRRDAI
jgi:hypothetical protein